MGFENHCSDLWVFVFRGFVSCYISFDLEIVKRGGALEKVEEGEIGGGFEGGN